MEPAKPLNITQFSIYSARSASKEAQKFYFPALFGNQDNPTDQPTAQTGQPTDGHEDSQGSYTSNMIRQNSFIFKFQKIQIARQQSASSRGLQARTVFKGRVHAFLTRQVWMSPVEASTIIKVLKIRRSKIFLLSIASLMTLCALFCHSISSHDQIRASTHLPSIVVVCRYSSSFSMQKKVRHTEHENGCA